MITFGEKTDHIPDTRNPKFSKVPFQCIFNDFGFLVEITQKIIIVESLCNFHVCRSLSKE